MTNPARLEFEIQVEDGAGLLLLRPLTLFGWLRVERLELLAPNVKLPGDLVQFRSQRCKVNACSLALDGEGVRQLIQARSAPLAAAGFTEIRARLSSGIELGGWARVGGEKCQIAVRIEPHFRGRSVELEVTAAHLIGRLRRPGWLLAHDLLSVLLGAGSGSADLLDETTPATVGLGRVRLQPLDLFLARALPPFGWKVPSSERVKLSRASLSSLTWTSDGSGLAEEPPRETQPTDAADEALLRSDLSGAAAAYVKSGGERAVDRALSVLLSRDSSLKAAQELAQESLQRWPRFVPALLALAALEGRGWDKVLAAVERGQLWLRLAQSAARTSASPELFEQILVEDPENAEAIEALAGHYAETQEWPKLAELLDRWAANAVEPGEKARHLVALAKVCSERLDDAARAASSLEKALQFDETSAPAWAELGKLRAAARENRGAIAAWEKLVSLQPSARTHAQLAGLYEQLDQLDQAQAHYTKSLQLHGADADLWARAATLADRRGDRETAAQAWARLMELAPPDEQRRLAEDSLLKLAVARGDLVESRRWRDAAQQPPAVEILLELARLEEARGELEATLHTLAPTLERVSPEEASGIELWRARLCAQLRRETDKRSALVGAWRRAPDSPTSREALHALVEDARFRRDDIAEARWIDELLGTETRPEWLLRRGELHARAREWLPARMLLERAGPDAAPRLYADVLGQLGEHRARAEVLTPLAAADPSLWIDVAEARLAARDAEGAEEALAKARDQSPGDPSVRAAEGELAWLRRDWEEVASAVPSLLEHARGATRARQLLRLGLALERQGAADEARERFREAVELPEASGDDLSTLWRHLAELEERAGSYEAAARTWTAAAGDQRSSDGDDARAEKHRRAAELLHRRLGKSDEAIAELEAALAVDPAHQASLDLLEAVQSELGNDAALANTFKKRLLALAGDPRRKELVRRLAELDSRRGDRDGALHAWQWVLEQDPTDPEALRHLASAALEGRDVKTAARLAAAVPQSNLEEEERHALLTQLGDLLFEAQPESAERALAGAQQIRTDAALLEKRVRLLLERLVDPMAALEVALAGWKQQPDDTRRLKLVAETALAADEPALRADALVRLLPSAASTDEWTHWVLEAAELFASRLNDQPRAQALYERILYADPKRLPPEALRAAARRARGQSDEAVLLTALRDSGYAEVDDLVRLAQLLAAMQQNSRAVDLLGEAIDRHVRDLAAQNRPLDDKGRTLLADLLAAAAVSATYGPAIRGLELAAGIEPDAAAAASSLGEASLLSRTQLGDFQHAANLLEQAIARRPGSALLLADFEAVMRHLGDPARLRRAYQAHLAELPIGPARAAVLTRLAQLSREIGDDAGFQHYQDQMAQLVPPRAPPAIIAPPPDQVRGRALFLAVTEGTSAAQPGLAGTELLGAIAELRRQVDLLPARDVEHSRALRQRLAWMYRRAGDIHAAFTEFDRLVQEEPENRTLIAALLETSMLESRWNDAIAALDRMQRLSDDSTERAVLIYRMGRLYEERLRNSDRAVAEYLRAVDLDPSSPPPLWRLVDHYWRAGDDANLIDIARLLFDLGAFTSPDVERTTQARAWVALALDAFEKHVSLTPPAALEAELTRALGELAERPTPPHSLAAAARRLALASAVIRK
jgi:tetratricopeptide (TPR) repeat protein